MRPLNLTTTPHPTFPSANATTASASSTPPRDQSRSGTHALSRVLVRKSSASSIGDSPRRTQPKTHRAASVLSDKGSSILSAPSASSFSRITATLSPARTQPPLSSRLSSARPRPTTIVTSPPPRAAPLSSARSAPRFSLSTTSTPLPRRSPSSASTLSSSTTSSAVPLSLSPSYSAPGARTPLRRRDHNVLRATPSTTRPAAAYPRLSAMFVGKDAGANHRTPQMTSLSTTSAAAAPGPGKGPGARTPITPKIAAKTGPAPTLATTPLARRPRADGPPTPHLAASHVSSAKDDYASPISSFLNNNVTPRSGRRQSRIDSTNNTPSGTPNPDRNDTPDARSITWASPANLDNDHLRRHLSPSPDGFGPRPESNAAHSHESKFFYASDAKVTSQHQAPAQRPLSVQPRSGPTFFYANGNSANADNPSTPVHSLSTPNLAAAPDALSSKFIYANGVPDMRPVAHSNPVSRGPGSTVSTAARTTVSRTGSSTPTGFQYPSIARPLSPRKMNSQPTLQGARAPGPAPLNLPKPQGLGIVSHPLGQPAVVARRRLSIEHEPQKASSHSRNGSVTSLGEMHHSSASPGALSTPSPRTEPDSPIPPPGAVPMTMASIIQMADELAPSPSSHQGSSPPHFEDKTDAVHGELHSPTKSTHSGDQLSELVANARRERKVQDLEITNASLEAINRTLERQLRKQTVELRRYKRLSRSGRLSLASTVSSLLGPEAAYGGAGVDGLGLSDLSEEDPAEDEEDLFDESDLTEDESNGARTSLTPTERAARDARRREKDEKRLQLDLTKHRELLVDSQKMNQSLKRCLNWTEELIKEGRKALAYQVRVSDVELGGRVLAPRDEDDEGSEGDTEMEAASEFQSEILSSPNDDSEREWTPEADRSTGSAMEGSRKPDGPPLEAG